MSFALTVYEAAVAPLIRTQLSAVDVASAPGVAVGDRLRSGPLAVRGRERSSLHRRTRHEGTSHVDRGSLHDLRRERAEPPLTGDVARSHSSADGRADVVRADRVRGVGRPNDQDAVEAVDVAPAPGVAVGDRLRSGPFAVRVVSVLPSAGAPDTSGRLILTGGSAASATELPPNAARRTTPASTSRIPRSAERSPAPRLLWVSLTGGFNPFLVACRKRRPILALAAFFAFPLGLPPEQPSDNGAWRSLRGERRVLSRLDVTPASDPGNC